MRHRHRVVGRVGSKLSPLFSTSVFATCEPVEMRNCRHLWTPGLLAFFERALDPLACPFVSPWDRKEYKNTAEISTGLTFLNQTLYKPYHKSPDTRRTAEVLFRPYLNPLQTPYKPHLNPASTLARRDKDLHLQETR